VEDIALRRPTLDEVFLALTGRTTGAGDRVRDNGGAHGDADTNESNDNDPTSPKEGEAA
jgi:hypothetical protein